MRTLSARIERFPIAGSFVISRGSRTEAVVVVAEIEENGVVGRGECVPYARYGETVEGMAEAILSQKEAIAAGLDRKALLDRLPAGAARNAIDCALWDLEAKQAGKRVWDLAGLSAPRPLTTCYTLSVGAPEAMAEAARKAAYRPLLKVKLAGDGDPERIAAVRAAAPETKLVVDANEAWTPQTLEANMAACAAAGVLLIEQPLPAGADGALAEIPHSTPVCADESAHDRGSLESLGKRYDAINVKLDKTGGLTEALALAAEAKQRGLMLMVGCMVGTSLAMAPALLVAQQAEFVDLDGPLLLAKDREDGLIYQGSLVQPPDSTLWG